MVGLNTYVGKYSYVGKFTDFTGPVHWKINGVKETVSLFGRYVRFNPLENSDVRKRNIWKEKCDKKQVIAF